MVNVYVYVAVVTTSFAFRMSIYVFCADVREGFLVLSLMLTSAYSFVPPSPPPPPLRNTFPSDGTGTMQHFIT